MKTYFKTLAIAAIMAITGVSASFAASVDFFLKIEGVNGESKIVKLNCPNGACATTVDGLKAGHYKFTLCTANGTPLLMKAKEKANRTRCTSTLRITPRDAASGQASGKMATQTGIVSPRDPASGLPTGKRMHKPITVTVEIDRSAAGGVFVAAGDLDGDGSVDIAFTCTSGGVTAMDDWEAPSH
ncbi:MAG TPA: hypothetical protein VFO76_05880 [Candidatus Kapabacteria bacterium]|nr:hypothetical protein [Candidatus Kapabacteria bacterium]